MRYQVKMQHVTWAILFVAGTITGCRSKISAPEGSAAPDPATATEDPPVPPDDAPSATKPATPTPTKKPPSDNSAALPKSPTTPEGQATTSLPGPYAPEVAKNYLAGVVTYYDLQAALPSGASYQIKHLQISESPVGELGTSEHFQMRGGIFLTH